MNSRKSMSLLNRLKNQKKSEIILPKILRNLSRKKSIFIKKPRIRLNTIKKTRLKRIKSGIITTNYKKTYCRPSKKLPTMPNNKSIKTKFCLKKSAKVKINFRKLTSIWKIVSFSFKNC